MWLDKKYIGLISPRLDLFKSIGPTTYNFRCPICGDSTKNLSKARGYIFPKNDSSGFLFHCHNCGTTKDWQHFLKDLDPVLYKEYRTEKFSERAKTKKTSVEEFTKKMKPPVFAKTDPLKKLRKISALDSSHPAVQYVSKRKIPNEYHYKLFYAPKFKKFVNSVVPNKFDSESCERDEPRLVIPFLNEKKECVGFQGRSFSKLGLRYITIPLYSTAPRIFGLDSCDRSQPHYILEGPIDSMFVNNSIAMCGNTIDWSVVNEHSIFVYDNEPRNESIVKKIQTVIEKGYSVVLFPESIQQKDINDMVLANVDIQSVLDYNISKGLEAKLIFTHWRKV